MWLHVEPTSRCNAWCPGCARNNFGYGLSKFIIQDLDPNILKTTIKQFNISRIQMCGNLGDPCAAKNLDDQLDVVKDIERLQIHTNGGLRKPRWWAALAKRFNHIKQFDVYFALDGIGDTHSYYRQGTSYDRVIENAQAFIDAGGSAFWQFIPFAHNEHQIEDCIKLSQKMGFKKFEFIRNARYKDKAYNYRTGEELDIKPWSQDKRFNRIYKIAKHVEEKNCMHLSIPSIFLSSTGLVTACCHMFDTPLKDVDIPNEFSNNNYRPVCIRSCG